MRPRTRVVCRLLVLVSGVVLLAPPVVSAQAVSAGEREALARQVVARGGNADDLDVVVRLVDDAAAGGVPSPPLVNKIREGLAKNVPLVRIEPVVRQLAIDLRTADGLLAELVTGAAMDRRLAVTRLGEALGSGVTPDEVRALVRRGDATGVTRSADALAAAARGLAFIKEARLLVAEGTEVLVEATRRGFRDFELVDLGREVKRREVDYQAGRATLRALRDAIVRGERPERLFPPVRPEVADRPAVTRPDAVERPVRPETPVRPEQPERPGVPERSARPN